MPSLRSWLQQASAKLQAVSQTPSLDAQVLLAHHLHQPRTWLLAHADQELDARLEPALNQDLSQLLKGFPLPYLLAQWEFFGLQFSVTPAVLIPRPETELLVETALAWLRSHPARRQAIDIGTGSGCIPIALAKHIQNLIITAVDISPAALYVAAQNAKTNGVQEQVRFINANLTQALRGQFDLIFSNPPYIPSRKLPGLKVASHEPLLALDGGPDGLNLISALLQDAARLLASDGLLLVEIEAGQGQAALNLAQRFFPSARSCVLPDLAGLPRLLQIEN